MPILLVIKLEFTEYEEEEVEQVEPTCISHDRFDVFPVYSEVAVGLVFLVEVVDQLLLHLCS